MPTTPTTQRMGELHEERIADAIGGVRTKASGSRWDEQADARNHHDLPFAFRCDGKSTKGKSITVTLEMLAKLREQAHGERPALPLRWYANEALTEVAEDWVLVTLDDLSELLDSARAYEAARPKIDSALSDLERIGAENEHLRDGLRQALVRVEELKMAATRIVADQERAVPGFVPRLPWVTVHTAYEPGDPTRRATLAGLRYEADGRQVPFEVEEIHVERSTSNRPRLFVNRMLVRSGDLYRDGVLVARVSEDRSIPETG